MQKLFKGGNYSRAETIRGNTVIISTSMQHILMGPLKNFVDDADDCFDDAKIVPSAICYKKVHILK